MAKGISIHIGVDYVDTNHYGTEHRLPYCVNDALFMQSIAKSNGFTSTLLVNEEATSHNLFYHLGLAASELAPDDILLLSLSGHGDLVEDKNDDESDGYDEGFLMHDKIIIDDQLYLYWARFRPGVRILVISDSCYCGTLTKNPRRMFLDFWGKSPSSSQPRVSGGILANNKEEYEPDLINIPAMLKVPIRCSVLLLAACQEDDVAGAGNRDLETRLSTFTEAIAECWQGGGFDGNYITFFAMVRSLLKEKKKAQKPNYYFIGASNPDFEHQVPFTIE